MQFIPRWKVDDKDCGVVTACNSRFMYGLEMLLETLADRVRVTVVDVGLTQYERHLLEIRGVVVKQCPLTPLHPITDKTSYLKPWWICQAGYRYTLWLDADTLVCGDLGPLFDHIKQQVFLMEHPRRLKAPIGYNAVLNKQFPVKKVNTAADKLNAGVCGFAMEREEDRALMAAWQKLVEAALAEPQVRRYIQYWDEGALHWAMAHLGLQGRLVRNQPGWDRFQYLHHVRDPDDMYRRLQIHTGDTVLHFIGKKPWEFWNTSEPA